MHNLFFISDLHFGHENVLKFSDLRYGDTVTEHDEWLITQWNSVVTNQDVVYVLGDVVFKKESLKYLKRLAGNKNLVRGNHDRWSAKTYLEYFNNIYGLLKKSGYWLSHAPIHPLELRGCKNIHGHVHQNSIPDSRYINVCVEQINGTPISIEQINEITK